VVVTAAILCAAPTTPIIAAAIVVATPATPAIVVGAVVVTAPATPAVVIGSVVVTTATAMLAGIISPTAAPTGAVQCHKADAGFRTVAGTGAPGPKGGSAIIHHLDPGRALDRLNPHLARGAGDLDARIPLRDIGLCQIGNVDLGKGSRAGRHTDQSEKNGSERH